MVKRGEKVVQKLQIVSDQSRIPKCTLDGSSGGTCKVLGKNTERWGQASASEEKNNKKGKHFRIGPTTGSCHSKNVIITFF